MSYRKIIFILCLSIFLSAERGANAQSTTFSYTGAVQAWTVPCNVTSITIDCYGAQGVGTNYEVHPGYGGEARGVMSVLPGEVLYLYVGGQSGWNGGGLGLMGANGGDATDVRYGGQTLADRIIVAGGGGGAGGDNWLCTGGVYGNGGGGTAVGTNFVGGGGGEGYTSGTGCGANGATNGGAGGGNGCHGGGGGGGGMVSGGGGATETCSSPTETATAGTLGQGGASYNSPDCISDNEGTGGGGGGYYGGGGAAGFNCGAGQGGGGSSWTGTLADPYFNYGLWTGNGKIVITQNNVPTPVTDTAFVITNSSCNGGSDGEASSRVTGGVLSTFTFSWAPIGETTDTATGLSAGSYTVTVTSACGGSASSSVIITQPAALSSHTTVLSNVLCYGESNGSAQVTGVAGDASSSYTYNWLPSNQSTAIANGLSAGIYTVTITDLCSVTVTAPVTITQPNPLSVGARVTADISCNGANNGSAWAQVTNGTAPYTYTWSPAGGNTDTAVGLSEGTYVLNVVDKNGCTGSAVITITQPMPLGLSVSTTANVACNGQSTGGVSSTAQGGTTPYTYAWTGGGNTPAVNGLSAGTYTLTLTDAHGCTLNRYTIITQPAALVVTKDSTPDNGQCSGATWVMVNGGVFPYTYLWTPSGKTTPYNYGACYDSDYCCTITDANGCKTTTCVTTGYDLGVDNIASSSPKITVYPNPNNGQFTVENAINTQWTIEVFNVLGERVYNQSNIQSASTNINLGNQPNGVYLYRVISSVNGNILGEGKLSIQK